MDGSFWSLYPYHDDLYTLTHVKWGRYLSDKRTEMESDIIHYYPELLQDFVFQESCFTTKHIMKSQCASRELQVIENNNIISVACGKITGIFDWQDFLQL